MDLGLSGKTAVVTGATQGIGLAVAEELAREGARVVVVARTPEKVKEVAEALGGTGVVADVTTAAGADAVLEACGNELSILINNVGGRFFGWDVGDFEQAMATNLYPAVRLSTSALPAMKAVGWGRIVVISSLYGREAGGAPAYNAAKAAEISFVTALGREVAATGVTVNAVAPGSILFEGGGWAARMAAEPEAMNEFVKREMPLGRFGSPAEVASVVAFLCSERASLVNGACWAVDGGQSRSNL